MVQVHHDTIHLLQWHVPTCDPNLRQLWVQMDINVLTTVDFVYLTVDREADIAVMIQGWTLFSFK